jgi:hypothetical protein
MTPLGDLIAAQHADLVQSAGFDTRCLLHALADVESSQGARRLASRHEKGYCYGSTLYRGPNGGDLRELSETWGCLAHSSFGTWQIMFIGAHEMGFAGDPIELREDAVSLPVVITFINRRILNRYQRLTVRAFADAYNSGSPNDDVVPQTYMDDFEASYNKWKRALDPATVLKA